MTKHVAIDITTGRHIREANQTEIAAYVAQNVRHPSFRKPVFVDGVLITEYNGPGINHIVGY